jgi:molybdopterin-binding protein/molybdate transport repressor ModE-like protein
VTSADVALLRGLAADGNIVGASRRAGLTRDQAMYRLLRLRRAFGGPVVASRRGGVDHGRSRLTPLGDRIVRQGFDALEMVGGRPAAAAGVPNRLRGTYHDGRAPRIALEGGHSVRVAFAGKEGDPVTVLLDPEAVLVAHRRVATSARNALFGRVLRVRRGRAGKPASLLASVGSLRLRVALTQETVRQMRLRPGVRVWLLFKATAVRPIGPPFGS